MKSCRIRTWDTSARQGHGPLREEISQWLFRERGISAAAGDIFITSGTTQALNLLVQIVAQKGRPFIVEDPCHLAIIEILKNKDLPYEAVAVDENGLKTELLEALSLSAVYVTPSHQFPLGGILPAERRASLIRLARKQNFYIIEDDYDSEFRYAGAPVTPLFSMNNERVLYVGTFSKTMYPALRVGICGTAAAASVEMALSAKISGCAESDHRAGSLGGIYASEKTG